MQTNCCFATQDKAWVRDPDGNEWEVFVVLKDNLPETAPCECGEKLTDENSVDKLVAPAPSCCAPTAAGIGR